MRLRARFEPRDLWIGAYWNVEERYGTLVHDSGYHLWTRWKALLVYVCILPMLPIILEVEFGQAAGKRGGNAKT